MCKICTKEASKFSRNWKAHYLTHVSSDEKPHKCDVCNMGYLSPALLRKHIDKKHSSVKNESFNSAEQGGHDTYFKHEGY